MNIAVFGLGYVGSVTTVGLAELGHQVVGVDIHAPKVDAMRRGEPPVHEPGLLPLLQKNLKQGRLQVTSDPIEAVKKSEMALVAVGTPSRSDGSANLEAVQRCIESIALVLRESDTDQPYTIIIRSTVPPGTTERLMALAAELSGRTLGDRLLGGMNPEFLREGSAIEDFFEPNLVVLGVDDAESGRSIEGLYASIKARKVTVSTRTAELAKYTNNAFHAMKISFANEVGRLAQSLDIDGQEVMRILCMDDKLNISTKYLRPGFAYGGSCLPKDLRALGALAQRAEVEIPLLEGVTKSNDSHIKAALHTILAERPRSVGILGVAFKPGTDDVRESPALRLAHDLCEHGVRVKMYDAHIKQSALLGSNRRYIDELLPGWQKHLVYSFEALTDEVDLIAVVNMESAYEEKLGAYQEREHATVIDLSGAL